MTSIPEFRITPQPDGTSQHSLTDHDVLAPSPDSIIEPGMDRQRMTKGRDSEPRVAVWENDADGYVIEVTVDSWQPTLTPSIVAVLEGTLAQAIASCAQVTSRPR
ncbi:MAG: hypothetical protein HQ453_03505 [Actinobacteria bacterium]|nr:hypothetical protein [Actinomycetota bacterium]